MIASKLFVFVYGNKKDTGWKSFISDIKKGGKLIFCIIEIHRVEHYLHMFKVINFLVGTFKGYLHLKYNNSVNEDCTDAPEKNSEY